MCSVMVVSPNVHVCGGVRLVCLYDQGCEVIWCTVERLVVHDAGGIVAATAPILSPANLVLAV